MRLIIVRQHHAPHATAGKQYPPLTDAQHDLNQARCAMHGSKMHASMNVELVTPIGADARLQRAAVITRVSACPLSEEGIQRVAPNAEPALKHLHAISRSPSTASAEPFAGRMIELSRLLDQHKELDHETERFSGMER
ncbi:MAG TPA: hypothetical protein VFB54_03475 [Burkholderiales bacterium]|nr:hypothetical protein [Burkholderiales bacterium]